MKFEEFNLSNTTLECLKNVGFQDATEVQEKTLPVSLSGKDVMVMAKTGSGKTAVFLLTIIEKFLIDNKSVALVISPTRELAVQIEEDAKKLASNIKNFKTGCFYGGVGYDEQNEEIKEGLSLYVGTPGRLLDFATSHKIDFRLFNTFVLDEADRMFDMGFFPDIKKIFSLLRSSEERQTMLFSATLSSRVKNTAWGFMNNPVEINATPEEITVSSITQELFHVSKNEKFLLLLGILKKEKPESVLIFTNTKNMAVEVAERLKLNAYSTEYLMGDMNQRKRLKIIERMKSGTLPILVATDVAARGLQIDDLALVINYDIPEDYENYVHRIGRTARAGKSGKSITLASEDYIYGLEAIEDYIGMKIPVHWADEDGIPIVEDLSKGYHYVPKRNTLSSRITKKTTHSYNKNKRLAAKDSYKNKKTKDVSNDNIDYSSLQKLSEKDRMSYYKSLYFDHEEVDIKEKSNAIKDINDNKEKKGFFTRLKEKFLKKKEKENGKK